jgi:nicotinate-nucleotide pyrophosphorylase (carboxylating)
MQSNIDKIILNALKEDMPFGDLTTDSLDINSTSSKAVLIAKQDAVLCGIDIFIRVFLLLDQTVTFNKLKEDGDAVKNGDIIVEFEGPTDILLIGERTALNLLQRLSGIATSTSEFVKAIEGLPTKIADTRKTTPGLRLLEKYAVRCGGGTNHRFCLSDGVLIKDNHIKAAGGIKNAVDLIRKKIPHTIKIEVETESIAMVQEALDAGVDIIMLDNMSIEQMSQAVNLVDKKALTEASGNIGDKGMDEVRNVAKTGVDIISVGRITHSAGSIDISMRIV